MMSTRQLLVACFVGIGFFAVDGATTGARSQQPQGICRNAINHVATQQRVPAVLMRAIALTESGRWDAGKRASVAWPWTVTAEGSGQFLPTKAAAIAEVRALQGRGVRNIDVGCMQINLRYHPDAFSSLDAAFDPVRNATYAAGFLSRLKVQTGAWWTAVGRYHSATPRLALTYQERVAARLDAGKGAAATAPAAAGTDAAVQLAQRQATEAAEAARRSAAEARRQEVITAYLEKRAARLADRGSGEQVVR